MCLWLYTSVLLEPKKQKMLVLHEGKILHVHIIDEVIKQFAYSGEQMCIDVSLHIIV